MVRIFAAIFLLAFLTHPAKAKEVKIKHNSLILNANLNLAPKKSIASGVVLMLHGTMAHKDMEIMRNLQDMLIERGISNLAINLSLTKENRHGMNDCAGPHRHRDSNAIKEIKLWVDWLKARGAKTITVLGHSRGGNQVARYVANKPDVTVKRIVVISPGTWKPGKSARRYKKNFSKELSSLLKKAHTFVKAGKGDTIMANVDFLYCPKTKVAAATFINYYEKFQDRDTPSVIKRIKLPVLAVVGDKDPVVPKFASRMKKSSQANVKLIIVEDAGHFFRDLFGEDLADAIAQFITQKN